jgi:hypothetical protein
MWKEKSHYGLLLNSSAGNERFDEKSESDCNARMYVWDAGS